VREYGRIAKVALGLTREAFRLSKTQQRFYGRLDDALRMDAAALDALPLTALAADIAASRPSCSSAGRPLIKELSLHAGVRLLAQVIARWAGPAGLELHNDIMIGPRRHHLGPSRRSASRAMVRLRPAIRTLSRRSRAATVQRSARHPALAQEVESYIAKFGDRCAEELKLEASRSPKTRGRCWRRLPAASQVRRAAVPDQSGRESRSTFLFAAKPFRRLVMRRVLSWTKARVRDRENCGSSAHACSAPPRAPAPVRRDRQPAHAHV